MRTKIIFICVVITISALLAACGGGGSNVATNANTVAANANSTNPLNTNTAPPEETVNNAPTLSPVFKAYCAAWVKNDEAALRKVYSADTMKQFEGEMKQEKTTSLLKLLSSDKVSGTPCEVRNEKITGDTATATIVSNKMPNGVKAVFVKENGEWKLTTKSPTISAVDKNAPAMNTAK